MLLSFLVYLSIHMDCQGGFQSTMQCNNLELPLMSELGHLVISLLAPVLHPVLSSVPQPSGAASWRMSRGSSRGKKHAPRTVVFRVISEYHPLLVTKATLFSLSW